MLDQSLSKPLFHSLFSHSRVQRVCLLVEILVAPAVLWRGRGPAGAAARSARRRRTCQGEDVGVPAGGDPAPALGPDPQLAAPLAPEEGASALRVGPAAHGEDMGHPALAGGAVVGRQAALPEPFVPIVFLAHLRRSVCPAAAPG